MIKQSDNRYTHESAKGWEVVNFGRGWDIQQVDDRGEFVRGLSDEPYDTAEEAIEALESWLCLDDPETDWTQEDEPQELFDENSPWHHRRYRSVRVVFDDDPEVGKSGRTKLRVKPEQPKTRLKPPPKPRLPGLPEEPHSSGDEA